MVALSTTKIAKTRNYQIGRGDIVLLSQQHKDRSFLRLRSGKTYEKLQIVGIIPNQLGIIPNQLGIIHNQSDEHSPKQSFVLVCETSVCPAVTVL
jgi:hypothetical protein